LIGEIIFVYYECFDGKGYFWGFDESEIFELVKIVLVVDIYDVMIVCDIYCELVSFYEVVVELCCVFGI